MTASPHDALFKAGFEQPERAAQLFRARLPDALVDAVDWAAMVGEPGSFISPELEGRHSDLLFSAPLLGDAPSPVYFYLLLEHQSSNDPDMPLRMLVYMTRIWERFRKDKPALPLPVVLPLVISHAPGGWSAPTHMAEMFSPSVREFAGSAAHIPDFEFLLEDLTHLSDEDIANRVAEIYSRLVLWLLRDARRATTLMAHLPAWAPAFSSALTAPSGTQALHQLFRYIALVTDEMHFDTFRAKLIELAPEVEPAAMTIAEELISRGKAEGRVEGRVEGLVEGRAEMLLRQLRLKFGDLTELQVAHVQAADLERLDRYIERVLFADSIVAVFAQ